MYIDRICANMQTSLTVALQQLGFDGLNSIVPYDAFKKVSTAHVMAVARECKLHIAFELNRTSPCEEIDDEEKLIILNRALMHHEIFIDRVRPELDASGEMSLAASAVFKVDEDEPGWRLEPMP
jgi:hypothetical protein